MSKLQTSNKTVRDARSVDTVWRWSEWKERYELIPTRIADSTSQRQNGVMEFRHVTFEEFVHHIGNPMLVGYVTATYDDLLRCFGLPDELFGDVQKVACEWALIFADGTGATIYPYGETSDVHGIPEGSYQWHIGGTCTAAVDRVVDTLGARLWEYLPGTPGHPDDRWDIPF